MASDGDFGSLKSNSNQDAIQNALDNTNLKGILRDYQSNNQIKADFDLAKNILKPSQKQLERGLELHKNSLVIDCYGFMPRAAYDGEQISAAINSKASNLEIQDIQEDMSMTRFVYNKKEREEFENAWKASGVTCIIQNAGEEGNEIKRLLKRLAHFTHATDMMSEFVRKAATPNDIIRAQKENRHVLYLAGYGVALPQDWI